MLRMAFLTKTWGVALLAAGIAAGFCLSGCGEVPTGGTAGPMAISGSFSPCGEGAD